MFSSSYSKKIGGEERDAGGTKGCVEWGVVPRPKGLDCKLRKNRQLLKTGVTTARYIGETVQAGVRFAKCWAGRKPILCGLSI